MNQSEPVDPRLPWVRRLHDLDAARATGTPGPRLEALRADGRRLGDALREGDRVVGVKTLDCTALPYPSRFAFNGAVPLPWPFITMVHRTLLVKLHSDEGHKHLLFNPSDVEAARATPFFKKLTDRMELVAPFAERLFAKRFRPIEEQLAAVGLGVDDIDVIAFDHFHTQDLRPLLGDGNGTPARFPRALLLAPRTEWQQWDGLHPMQRPWFIADGKKGVPEDRVVLFDGDLALGRGALLLSTPGHTAGNQTLFVHSDEGVFGCSENGCSADSWAPHQSTIPGLRRFVDYYDLDVILNSNTPELGAEQYTSMMLEKSVVDPAVDDPAFVQMFPSSEVTPTPLAPGIQPAMVFGHRDGGCFAR